MVSFDVVSLFIRVSIKVTMDLLGRRFEEGTLGLFRHVLATSYFLKDVFKQNGYKDQQIHRALNRLLHLDQPDEPNSVAFMPLVGTIFNRISRVLA
jgi:hypothetical protein